MDNKFTVIFYDEDGKTILDKQEAKKGQSITYKGKTPEKAPENGIEYTFIGWETTGNIVSVMQDTDLFAKYEEASKVNFQSTELTFDLLEENTEEAKLSDVMKSGKKLVDTEKVVRNFTAEQKINLVNEIKEKGFVSLGLEAENERD